MKKFLVVFLIVAGLLVATPTFAQTATMTTAQLQELIANLQAQVQALMQQLAVLTSGGASGSASLVISRGDVEINDPHTIQVDTTSDTNNVEVLNFNLTANNAGYSPRSLVFRVDSVGAGVTEIANDFRLMDNNRKGGAEVGDLVIDRNCSGWNDGFAANPDTSICVRADGLNDDEVSVGLGQTRNFTLWADINDLDGNFTPGDSLKVLMTPAMQIGLPEATGSAESGPIVFADSGISVNNFVTTSTALLDYGSSSAPDHRGEYVMTFDVESFGDPAWIPLTASADKSAGVVFQMENSAGLEVKGDQQTATLSKISGSGSTSGGYLHLEEGQKARLQLTVVSKPYAAGYYHVQLNGVSFNSFSASQPDKQQLTPGSTFESNNLYIVGDASTPTPSIRVISPNGGEVWKIGENHKIKLNQSVTGNFPVGPRIGLSLIDRAGNGDIVGLIDCLNGTYSEFTWGTKTLMNFCGAAASGKYKDVLPGVYKIRISADTTILAESDFFTITDATVPTNSNLPDLRVTGISISPANPKSGDAVKITARVQNQGKADVPAGTWLGVGISVDGKINGGQPNGVWVGTKAGLKAGAEVSLTTDEARAWRPVVSQTKSFVLAAQADDQGLISESNEQNNRLETMANVTASSVVTNEPAPVIQPTPSVSRPDLKIVGISISPNSPKAGDAVTITARVQNVGTADVPAGTWIGLLYRVNGVVNGGQAGGIWSGTNAGIPAGQTVILTTDAARAWKPTPTQTQTFTLSGQIDDQSQVVESNESNNILDTMVNVTGAATTQSGSAWQAVQSLFHR